MNDEPKRYASWELPEEIWTLLEPLLPIRNWWMGRPTEGDLHRVAAGIFFALRTGIQWNALPREQFGPPSTVYYYFKQWRDANVFRKLWVKALEHYDAEIGLEWLWQSLDAAITKAPQGGEKNRTQPDGPWQVGDEAQRVERREGDTVGTGGGWSQPQ